MSAIVARKLTKSYGELKAVDALDLEIERGTLYGFLGPNGAGKTTTIRMVLGLIFPTAGEVEVLDEPMFASATPKVLRRVGALVEEPGFWRYLTGRRNLECFARAAGPAADRAARLGRIDEVLRLVDLSDAAGKKVKAYSQGMRQRLGVALALLGQPDLLVLDEPTNGLDPQGMRDMRRLMRRLADDGTTVFVSSHLLAEVEAICDRVAVLAQGRLVAQGAPKELRAGSDMLRIDVDDRARAEQILAALPGVGIEPREDGTSVYVRLSPPATAASVNNDLVHGGVAVSALVPERATLEDVFIALVEGAEAPR
ncbi:MAG: ABC transporter ATP-binding protein [Actinobacteria bacterium]|nr:MAG: ABC transporter ATP-binding protein [Actinomycetota bacterium]